MNKFYVFNSHFNFIVLAENPVQAIMKTIDKIPDKVKGEHINVSETGFLIRKPDKHLTFVTAQMLEIHRKRDSV